MTAVEAQSRGGQRWSLTGMTALVTGGTRGIGFSSFSFSLDLRFVIFNHYIFNSASCFLFVYSDLSFFFASNIFFIYVVVLDMGLVCFTKVIFNVMTVTYEYFVDSIFNKKRKRKVSFET